MDAIDKILKDLHKVRLQIMKEEENADKVDRENMYRRIKILDLADTKLVDASHILLILANEDYPRFVDGRKRRDRMFKKSTAYWDEACNIMGIKKLTKAQWKKEILNLKKVKTLWPL